MASLLYRKHSFNVSDEEVVVHWSENVLWQFFSGMDYYEHRLPCDATQVGRFRRDLGEDGMELLLKATIDAAVGHQGGQAQRSGARDRRLSVQEKAIVALLLVFSQLALYAACIGNSLQASMPNVGQRNQRERSPSHQDAFGIAAAGG